MAGSYPLGFGELLVGTILIVYGAKAIGRGTESAGTTGGAGVSVVDPTDPGFVSELSKRAADLLSPDQQKFTARLSAKTGLDPDVVASWVHAEMPKTASQAPNGAHNWLNIGAFTEGGWIGANTPEWNDPIAAADLTADWLSGADIPGIGKAGAQIPRILDSVGKSAQAQIMAIRNSGWATSGYPLLQQIFDMIR